LAEHLDVALGVVVDGGHSLTSHVPPARAMRTLFVLPTWGQRLRLAICPFIKVAGIRGVIETTDKCLGWPGIPRLENPE
jgi:hypothetical protein